MAGVTNGALARFATTTETALALPPGLPRSEWEQIGETLHAIQRGVDWWLADWWLYGDREYGQAAAQAAPLGVAAKTLQNAAWVGSKIEPSRRREDLTIGHHAAVAGLDDPDEQDQWLDKAAGSDWSVGELRGRIRNSTRDVTQPTDAEKLLRRAAEAYQRDPDAAGGLADFMALADTAWRLALGLVATSS
jgi:hypothetical protein